MLSCIFNYFSKYVCALEKLFLIVSQFPTKKTRLAAGVHGSCAAVNTEGTRNFNPGLCKGRFQLQSHFAVFVDCSFFKLPGNWA